MIYYNPGDDLSEIDSNNVMTMDLSSVFPSSMFGYGFGDIDNDGGLDLLVTNIAGHAKLYRNMHPGRGHWLLVRALDPALNRDAYGAEVYVTAESVDNAGALEVRLRSGRASSSLMLRCGYRVWPSGSRSSSTT